MSKTVALVFGRGICSVALALLALGCGGTHIDDTGNKMNMGTVNYPTGPFGYDKQTIIQNIDFIGKRDPNGAAGTANYAGLPMEKISLADYYGDPNVKFILLNGAAGWCGPCNDEQAQVPDLQKKYEPKGVRIIEALMEGFSASNAMPATEQDINRWQDRHEIHVAIGLDPEKRMFNYAEISAFPVNMVIRTSDMMIMFRETGNQDIDQVLADYAP